MGADNFFSTFKCIDEMCFFLDRSPVKLLLSGVRGVFFSKIEGANDKVEKKIKFHMQEKMVDFVDIICFGGVWGQVVFLGGTKEAHPEYINFIVCTSFGEGVGKFTHLLIYFNQSFGAEHEREPEQTEQRFLPGMGAPTFFIVRAPV